MSSRTRRMISAALILGPLGALLGACRAPAAPPAPGALAPRRAASADSTVGLLVMAHGGSPTWDQAVGDAVAPLRSLVPTALALGMAHPVTLQAAVDSLEARGVTRIAVVRLFLSGSSFLERTEFLLGLRAEPPGHDTTHAMEHAMEHAMTRAHPDRLANLAPLTHRAAFLLSREGLSAADIVPDILARRGREAAPAADRPVLVLAHGMGDEAENRALLERMERTVEAVREAGFPTVRAATLREDWPEARRSSEADIRGWATTASSSGAEVVVVPYRLFGFGPYAEVLRGIPHLGTEGILPDPLVSRWIAEQARRLFCSEGLSTPLGPCANSAVVPG